MKLLKAFLVAALAAQAWSKPVGSPLPDAVATAVGELKPRDTQYYTTPVDLRSPPPFSGACVS